MAAVLTMGLALVCTVVPFAMGQRFGCVRLLSPMHLLSYFCLFGFLIKVMVYAYLPELAFYRQFIDTLWADQLAALYLACFILLICVGYRLAYRPFARSDSVAVARFIAGGVAHRRVLFWLAFTVAFVTVLMILRARGAVVLDLSVVTGLNRTKQINVNADGVGATLAGVKTFFIVPKFAFVLLCAHAIVTRMWGAWVQTVFLALLLMLIAVISGDRFELLELSIYAFAVFVILGGVMTWLRIMICVGVFAMMAGLAAFMTQLRLSSTEIPLLALARQVVGSTYFLDINAAAMVTDRVTSQDMLYGQSYLWWTFGWVPRAIWVDKPAIDLGVFLKRDIMALYTGGAFNVTGPGEAFINFGWPGMGVGLILGWFYRKGEVFLLRAAMGLRYGAFLLYPVLFYPFVQATLQSSFSAFIVGAVAQMMLIALMIAVFVPRYHPRPVSRIPVKEPSICGLNLC